MNLFDFSRHIAELKKEKRYSEALSYFKENESLTLGDFRDLIESSRRYALPLLEKIDQLKITQREEELRYPGENLK